jgi:predicted AlkP superfamily phosphohydrolase/phosphomutase
MVDKLIIVGIDSLDPYIILKYRSELPNFSKLIDESPTYISESVFPVDTIPAWMSIYTGLHPGNHGILYVYDIFDPNLSDLRKLNISHIKGKTFWDYASQEGFRTIVLYPMLMYPTWKINGIMISKSPFESRIDWIRTETDVDVYPNIIRKIYNIPNKFEGLWGGFPGNRYLKKWAEFGKKIVKREGSFTV